MRQEALELMGASPQDLLPNIDEEDHVVWEGDASGKYTTKSAMKQLCETGNAVAWSKLVWCKKRIPAHAFILWLLCKDRLRTKDRLENLGTSINPNCELCNADKESKAHLFFLCSYCKQVWEQVQKKCLVFRCAQVQDDELQWILKHCMEDTFYGKLEEQLQQPPSINIWRSRNMKIFQNKTLTANEVISKVIAVIRGAIAGWSQRKQWKIGTYVQKGRNVVLVQRGVEEIS